jgi:hypothetical protein
MSLFGRSMFSVIVAVTASTVSAACALRDDSTQITVAITSETEIPKELDQLEVIVTAEDGSVVNNVIHDVKNPRLLPATLAVIPRSEKSLRGPVRIEVRGLLNGTSTQVFRRAIVSYSEGRTLLLRMPLRMACLGFADCGNDDTCAGGTCQPAKTAQSTLVDYRDDQVFGNRAPSSCFDEAACLASSVTIPVFTEDCSFDIPEAVGGVEPNISIRWRDAPDRIIVLDADDPVEGWSRISATRALLSKGVCASLRDAEPLKSKRAVPEQALDVYLSTRCPSKKPLQPFCPAPSGNTGVGVTIKR